jgi:outer membrane protein OmpA-like peptidoglycan-associated protein
MNHLKKLAIAIVFLLFGVPFSRSSNDPKPDNKIIRKADNLFIFGDFRSALPIYQKLQESDPENVQFNYRLGVCYFYSSSDLLKCVSFFEKAQKGLNENDEETIDLYYYLGIIYRTVNRFDEAIRCFSKLKEKILPDKEGLRDIRELEMQIASCEYGKKLMQHPLPVSIINAGSAINSEYPDYSPVISKDESMLLFTSKRKECTGGRIDEEGNYYEDIFISRKEKDNQWLSSVQLDSSVLMQKKILFFKVSKSKKDNAINTRQHDASVALSPDGKQLFIYRLDDLWVSDLKNENWEKPTKLNHFINGRKSHEPSLSLTMDEKTLYFVSERNGGYGGKDIYRSEKQKDGSWGEPVNLGPVINTEFDEDAPYIDPENKTLYFSSEGHGTMGGFDIFRSKFDTKEWTVPENMGYPINSGADDIFYVFNSSLNTAYFSSIRENGMGNFDIYKIDFNQPENEKYIKTIIAVKKNDKLKTTPTTIALSSGRDLDSLRLTNKISDGGIYNPGKTYSITIPNAGSDESVFEFEIPRNSKSDNYFQEILIEDIKNEKNEVTGYKTFLYNAFIDMDSAIRNTEFALIPDKIEAYSAYLKSRKGKDLGITNYIFENKITTPSLSAPNKTIAFEPILFEFGKYDIMPGSPGMDKIYEYLKNDSQASLIINGYTDSKGDEVYNQKLSELRALKAKTYFTKKGIANSRIVAVGKGESNPVSNNINEDGSDNPEGRKLNRRIEFEIHRY